ncbi:hypothetical protein [Wolbachia endosymbiont (group B) of Ischnura elegans]|uniref:hypothetical protein n=1 Tax=Wolbachia endosymbiont (group B) of Ischnura elegans TaxID=2954021 RepID=UPI0029FF253A|nr:hypothetical protein [Wolbachia endosymbiont (group B) of Ischnura elegans]
MTCSDYCEKSYTAIAVALFATRTVTAELIPIVIAVAAITAAALTVGNVTYKLLSNRSRIVRMN